jgi:hypothetical protein
MDGFIDETATRMNEFRWKDEKNVWESRIPCIPKTDG